MPADIRNFFGGKSGGPVIKQDKKTAEPQNSNNTAKRRNRTRNVVDDSDDDAIENAAATPKKATPRKSKVKESPTGEETSTTDYFATKGKPKQTSATSAAQKAKQRPHEEKPLTPAKSTRQSKESASTQGSAGRRGSARKQKAVQYVELDDDELEKLLDDDMDTGDDIFAADVKKNGTNGHDEYVVSDDDGGAITKPRKTASRQKADLEGKAESSSKDVGRTHNSGKIGNASTPNKKRKSAELDSDDGEDFETGSKQTSARKAAKRPAAKKSRPGKEEPNEDAATQAILDSITTIKAPSPPPRDADKKFDWRAGGGGNAGPPPAAGAKEIPEGAENCLAGLTFVFTGLLETISRDEAQDLVKRYGGRVTGAPSSKTSYVVLGSDAGPSKLEKIKSMNIKTINEDGLFELVRRLPPSGGSSKAAEKEMEKKRAEEEKAKRNAAEMAKEERRLAAESEAAAKRAAAARGLSTAPPPRALPSAQLWTSKYAPTQMNQICGNKGQVEKIQKWLEQWHRSRRRNFELAGADGTGKYRAIIIHGPPGIGKTTAAHLAARLAGYDVIESNASDTRSKKLVETGLGDVLNNNSLLGFFAGDGKEVNKQRKKIVLIMDEVDGMSAGDRGGVGALAKVCKITDVPLILICNERRIPKMKPFDHVAYDIPFRRPTVAEVRSRIATICIREGLQIPMPVIEALIEGSNKDIRQIINMLSTAKLDQSSMSFDEGKAMSKAWEKHIVLKPWDICHQLLGSGMFAASSKATLNDKIELYFNDHEMSYLMVQENYLRTRPMLANTPGLTPREQKLKVLELADRAAESISDGDLVDRMIHGSQQQWSLMPTHAVFSTVRPASFMSGAMSGSTSFTSWLGNNSKYGKMARYIKEIQSHMRLRTSGDRHEIRQQYLPVLWEQIFKRLERDGKDCVGQIIDLMDSYFLTKDDFDYMLELGLAHQSQEGVNIPSQMKATFTRLYNSSSHPLPFMKSTSASSVPKAAKVAPDLEEAIEDDDAEVPLDTPEDVDAPEDDVDVLKDKYIKKPKPANAKAAGGKKGKKASKTLEGEDGASDQAAKPKTARGKKAANTKAKSGK